MSIIVQQKQEIERLRAQKQEIESDLLELMLAVKGAWDYIGLDFDKLKSPMHVASTLLKKITLGKIKAEVFEQKWHAIEPTIKKYGHLIEQAQKQLPESEPEMKNVLPL